MAKSELAVNTLQFLTITSTSTPQSTQKRSIKRLAVGPVVGLVVGVSVILAALTGICVFILMRKRKRTQSSTASQIKLEKRQSGREVRQDPSVKAQDQSAVPKVQGQSAVRKVDVYWRLPQPIADSELLRECGMLCVTIKNHVHDCYDEDKAGQEYHVDESSPPAYLEPHHLANPKARHLEIRQSIGKIILENINPQATPNDTFLPPKLVSIIRSMPIIPDEEHPILEAALAKWRVITQFLLCPERNKTSPEYMINSDMITKVAETLSNDLQPYLLPGIVSKEECKESLEKTLRCGAKFGLRLFSQGSRWCFGDLDIRERKDEYGRPCLVVLPALLKFTDEDGHFIVKNSRVRREETCFDY